MHQALEKTSRFESMAKTCRKFESVAASQEIMSSRQVFGTHLWAYTGL